MDQLINRLVALTGIQTTTRKNPTGVTYCGRQLWLGDHHELRIFHELMHHVVAEHWQRRLPEWGMASAYLATRSVTREQEIEQEILSRYLEPCVAEKLGFARPVVHETWYTHQYGNERYQSALKQAPSVRERIFREFG